MRAFDAGGRSCIDMTFMTGNPKLMATDAKGRVRVPVKRREALLEEFER
jgi:hypothetical protein